MEIRHGRSRLKLNASVELRPMEVNVTSPPKRMYTGQGCAGRLAVYRDGKWRGAPGPA